MSEAQDYAQFLFDGGLNCAESTVASLSRFLGVESHLIPQIATGFGGGFARTKGVCGAVTGAVMGLGLLFGRNQAQESKEICYQKTQEFINSFLETFGSLNCFELSGIDFNTPQGARLYREKAHSERCVRLVRFAVEKVLSLRPE
ncbi:MAG: C-GCAxxG-C-C family protein [bacterium]